MKHLPNLISIARILLSLCLPVVDHTGLFLFCYLLCGISDVLDGMVARRFKLETRLGEQLDSLGDLVFWAVILALFFSRTDLGSPWLLAGVGVVALLRAGNLCITRTKFRRWSMLHSWGNKAAGLLLYALLPMWMFRGEVGVLTGGLLFAVALLSCLDEAAILLSAKEYDANRRGYYF